MLFQLALPAGDGEGLAGVTLRRDAADLEPLDHAVLAGLAARIQLEHLAAQVQALAAHARAVGADPGPGVAVFAGRRLDEVVPRVRRRLGEFRGRDLGPGGRRDEDDEAIQQMLATHDDSHQMAIRIGREHSGSARPNHFRTPRDIATIRSLCPVLRYFFPSHFHRPPASAAPRMGATQNSHSWPSAQPPTSSAGPVLRAGFTEVLVMGMLTR